MQKEKVSSMSQEEPKFPLWKKAVIALGTATVIGAIIYATSREKENQGGIEDSDFEDQEEEPIRSEPRPSSDPFGKEDEFPLKYGSRGERVRIIQKALNKSFKAGLKEDGDWGPKTQKAIETAQRRFPQLIPTTTITRKMYEFLERAYRKGTLPTVDSLNGPSGFMVEAITDTVIWNDTDNLIFQSGELIGSHLATNNGYTYIQVEGYGPMTAKSIDVLIR